MVTRKRDGVGRVFRDVPLNPKKGYVLFIRLPDSPKVSRVRGRRITDLRALIWDAYPSTDIVQLDVDGSDDPLQQLAQYFDEVFGEPDDEDDDREYDFPATVRGVVVDTATANVLSLVSSHEDCPEENCGVDWHYIDYLVDPLKLIKFGS